MQDETTNGGGTLRGRPVLKRLEIADQARLAVSLEKLAQEGRLWIFCGEYDAKGGTVGEGVAVDLAHREHGSGIYQAFDGGTWGRGYWRG